MSFINAWMHVSRRAAQPLLQSRAHLGAGPGYGAQSLQPDFRVSGVSVLPWSSLLHPSHFSRITAHSSSVHSPLPPLSFMLSLLLSFTHLCLSSETASSVGSSLLSFTALEPAPLLICDAHFSLLFEVSSQAYNVIRLCSYNLFFFFIQNNTRAMRDYKYQSHGRS